MRHLIPTILLVPSVFWYLAKRRSAKEASYLLCFVPLFLYLSGFLSEKSFGYGLTAPALFHFSYDTSYVLTLIGLIVLLYLSKNERPFGFMLALVISVAPLLELLF